MKNKDLAMIVTIVSLILGILIIIAGVGAVGLYFLVYAWASYYRYKGGTTSKRVCIAISYVLAICYVVAYEDGKMADLIYWLVMAAIDTKLLNQKI